jgi:predicted GIY-YIG superfamily endonuclease
MTKFFYVYISQSEVNLQRFYTGLTDDLRTRLKNHILAASFTRLNGSRGKSKPTSLFVIAIERLGLSGI